MLIQKIANQTNDVLILLDSDLKVIVFNKSAEDLFGISEKDSQGKAFSNVCKDANIRCRPWKLEERGL